MTNQSLNQVKSKSAAESAAKNSLTLENRRQTIKKTPVPGGEPHRWQPGQSGNPGGRPRTGALAKACRDLLERPVPGDRAGRTYAQAIAERLADLALQGHMGAVRELGDRAEGRAGNLLNVEIRPVSDQLNTVRLDDTAALSAEAIAIGSASEAKHAKTDQLLP